MSEAKTVTDDKPNTDGTDVSVDETKRVETTTIDNDTGAIVEEVVLEVTEELEPWQKAIEELTVATALQTENLTNQITTLSDKVSQLQVTAASPAPESTTQLEESKSSSPATLETVSPEAQTPTEVPQSVEAANPVAAVVEAVVPAKRKHRLI